MLAQVHPALRPRIQLILQSLQVRGCSPRIREAWRSQNDQARLYASGQSNVTWSFHNAQDRDGKPEALAVDIVEDGADSPAFPLMLAAAVRAEDLCWGGVWGLTKRQREIVWAAVDARAWDACVRLGTDPQHVEINGITLIQARSGERPSYGK